MKKRRRHSAEIKTKAVLEALKENRTIAEVASRCDVYPKLLAQWKQEFLENATTVFNRKKVMGSMIKTEDKNPLC